MNQPHMSLVITTINVPTLLEEYVDNFEKYGHLKHTSAIVIGDKKTPHDECKKLCGKLRDRGFRAQYVDLPEQEKYLDRFPKFKPLVPYNSDNRRNIGYLMAAEQGADILVAVDDDNFVMSEDWYAGHAHLGKVGTYKTVTTTTGWYNPCDLMNLEPNLRVYARGYPYNKRWVPHEEKYTQTQGRVVLNGGLWLREPDVDSLTRLSVPSQGKSMKEPRIMLAPGVMAPINTQNTAFHRDTVPAFYFVPVGDPVSGLPVERYGDIWAGYFVKKAIDHLGDRITYGAPACDHRRNVHRLLHDLELELWSVQFSDQLAEHVLSTPMKSSNYCDAYLELADHLERAEWKHKRVAGEAKAFFDRMARAMRVWVDVCRKIGY